MSSDRLSDV